jgi:hypothetical protein
MISMISMIAKQHACRSALFEQLTALTNLHKVALSAEVTGVQGSTRRMIVKDVKGSGSG